MVSKEQKAKQDRIIKGVREILEFRGYEISKTEEDDDNLDVYGIKTTEDGEKSNAMARFHKNPQIGVAIIRILAKHQEENEIDYALIVAAGSLTHYAKKESLKRGIEIISSNNPLFNIFHHDLVPKHIRMNSKEVKAFLKRFQIEKHQIPKILETDPAVKAIQAKPGDVIKIVRNPTMGDDGSYYRIVIKSASRLRLSKSKKRKKKKSTSKSKKKPKKAKPKKKEKPAIKVKISDIEGVGSKTAMVLKDNGFDTVEKIAKASLENITEVPGIGQVTGQKIIATAKSLLKENK